MSMDPDDFVAQLVPALRARVSELQVSMQQVLLRQVSASPAAVTLMTARASRDQQVPVACQIECCNFVPLLACRWGSKWHVAASQHKPVIAWVIVCVYHQQVSCPSLQSLQDKHDDLEKQFRKERAELEEKYAKLYGKHHRSCSRDSSSTSNDGNTAVAVQSRSELANPSASSWHSFGHMREGPSCNLYQSVRIAAAQTKPSKQPARFISSLGNCLLILCHGLPAIAMVRQQVSLMSPVLLTISPCCK